MKVVYKLRNEKKDALEAAQNLVTIAENEDRDMNEDEKAGYDELITKADSLSGRIERAEATEAKLLEAKGTPVEDNFENVTVGKNRLEDDPKMGFENMGAFALAVRDAGDPNIKIVDERLKIQAAVSGHSVTTPADGGYLTPAAYSNIIKDGVMGSSDSLLAYTDNYTVAPNSDSLTFPAVNETSRATGSRWGGTRAYWLTEGAQMTTSHGTFRTVTVTPNELGVICHTTNKLLKNSTALSQFITRSSIDELNWAIGYSIINGSGSGQPNGILSGDGVIDVQRETDQVADSIVAANINRMWSRFPVQSRKNAIWFINQDYERFLDGVNIVLGDNAGSNLAAGFSAKIYDAEKNTLKGRPVIPCEYVPTVGTAGDILLIDPKAYLVGLRGGVSSDLSIHLRFDYNESVFRFVIELDGAPWYANPVTPANSTNTISPYVALNATNPS